MGVTGRWSRPPPKNSAPKSAERFDGVGGDFSPFRPARQRHFAREGEDRAVLRRGFEGKDAVVDLGERKFHADRRQ